MGGGEGSPRDSRGQNNALSPSPPVAEASSATASSSSSVDVVPTSRTVVTSPFSVGREYAFTHIHTQPGQVSTISSVPNFCDRGTLCYVSSLFLFCHTTISVLHYETEKLITLCEMIIRDMMEFIFPVQISTVPSMP
jgi:hypothetical protein